MKVFYTAAQGSHDMQAIELVTSTVPAVLRRLGHQLYVHTYNPSNAGHNGTFDDTAQKIIEADVFIGEMSRASQTLGFQLAYAISNTKPSLYLYDANTKAQPGAVIMANPSRLLRVQTYDRGSLEHVLKKFLDYAASQLNSVRTSFMSTRAIDKYISERAGRLGMAKAEVIRQVLSEAAEHNR